MPTPTQTAADLFATFSKVYAERMTAAAHIGNGACVEQMTQARDALVGLLGCSSLEAANMVRGLQVLFCEGLGLETPPAHRAALLEVLAC
jgi:hypothetical protein